jgi:hypothetical protein
MADKAAFVRHVRHLRWQMWGAVILMLCSVFFYPRAAFIGWTLFVAVWGLLLWRLRCWNCGVRLFEDGGSHLEMRKTSTFRWTLQRHKTCGAELSK